MDVVVKALDPGAKYILQARSISKDGKQSPWSNSFRITTISDTVAPSPPSGLSWVVNKSGFHGTWTKPTTDSDGKPLKDFNGYEITVTADSISKKFISMQEVFDLTFDQDVILFESPQPSVQISIKTRDILGNLSTAVTATATNPVPADVAGLTATGVPGAIILDWDDTLEDDFKNYEVYSSTVAVFTPGPSNLVATTSSSQFSFPTGDTIVHYFKVRQLDVYNQASGYDSASGSALDTTGIDTTPPDAPSAIVVTSAADSAGLAHIDVSWTASASSNLGGYVVRYSTDEVTWRYINVPADSTETTIGNLKPGVAYYVSVASVSFVSTYSAWIHAGTYPITTAADTTAPSTPSTPSVSFNTQTVQISHDLTKFGGGNLEADVRYLEIHASTSSGFTASSTTLIGSLDVAAPGVAVVGSFPAPVTTSVSNMYWRVKAVDYAGNKSTQSAQATGLPGLIQGANISDATIDNAKINNLSAAKLIAGTAFVNNLSVQSQLTLDASSGYIASTNFSIPSKTGWRLDQNGLVIYDGSIAAKSLLLQNGNNITPAPFADFEFNSDYYHDTSNVVNTVTMTATSGMLLNMLFTGVKTGKQSLRLWNTSITGSTVHKLHFATDGDSATGVNIDVNPGDYIVSIWAKKNGAVDQTLKFGLYPDTGAAIESTGLTVNNTSWTRYSAVLTVPSGVSKVKQYISLQAVTTGYDVVIDALQLEPKLTAETTPSAWKPPSSTVIDGGSIITGSIRSSASSATVAGQPAWSINTAGNLQIGDALIRGKITMGLIADQKNLMPKLFASFESAASNYYNVSTNVPNSANFTFLGTGVSNLRMQQSTAGSPPHGTYGLRTYATSGLVANNFYDIFPGSGNLALVPGQQYIISLYAKNNDVTKSTKIGFGVYNSTDGFTIGGSVIPLTTSYVRYSAVITAPATTPNTLYLAFQTQTGETAVDITWDAIQVETAPVGVTTPSTFTDGTNGLSSMASANYTSGTTGWTINSDGTVEFNAATIRGQLIVTGPAGNVKTDLNGSYPTIFFNGIDGSQAFINAAAGGSNKALIGINSATYTQGSNTVRPRLWMPDQIRLEQRDETAGAYYGGALVLDKTASRFGVYDASNLERASMVQQNDGTIYIETWDATDHSLSAIAFENSPAIRMQTFSGATQERSAIYQDNSGVILSTKDASGTLLGNIQIGTTNTVIGTASNVFVQFDFATGFLYRAPNGTSWFAPTLTTPSGGTGPWIQRSGWTTFGCKITPDGMVRFRGSLLPNSAANAGDGKQICTLPAQFRPPDDVICPVAVDSTGGTGSPRMWVQANGAVLMYGVGNNAVGFDNVQYSLI